MENKPTAEKGTCSIQLQNIRFFDYTLIENELFKKFDDVVLMCQQGDGMQVFLSVDEAIKKELFGSILESNYEKKIEEMLIRNLRQNPLPMINMLKDKYIIQEITLELDYFPKMGRLYGHQLIVFSYSEKRLEELVEYGKHRH